MKKTRYYVLIAFAILMMPILSGLIAANGTANPTIATDKADYAPGETVIVTGEGFAPGDYDIPIIRPDGTIVTGDGTFTEGWDTIQADSEGTFIYSYILDGIFGLYEVRVYASPWLGDLNQPALATTTFTDAPAADIDQIRNGPADDPWDPAEWVNGNAGPQNAHYAEGYSVAYRAVMTDLPADSTVIELIIGFDVKHGDRHAIDYLTHYDRIDTPGAPHNTVFGHPTEEINPLAGISGLDLVTDLDTFLIPKPLTSYDYSTGDIVTGMPGASWQNIYDTEGPEALEMSIWGGDITNVYYYMDDEGDLSLAQDEARIAIEFTTYSETAVLAWGGHIASRLDWGYDAEGHPRSAGGLSGSPYHMRLLDWNLGNLGNQDRSLKVAAVFVPGSITVVKETIPEPSDEVFEFTSTTLSPSPFYLDDDGLDDDDTITFGGLAAGTYDVTEIVPTGWDLTSIDIIETGTEDSTYSGPTASIILNEGETVVITYTNTERGKIIVDKVTVPSGSATVFDFTSDFDDPFTLTDAQAPWESDLLEPGSYSVTELAEAGWDLTAMSIVDPSGGSSYVLATGVASIDLAAGETVTVTYTNTERGKITVVKSALPNDLQDFDYTGDLGPFTLDDDAGVPGADMTYSNNKVFDNVLPDTYDVTEIVPTWWELYGIDILYDDGDSTYDLGTATATLVVDPGEEITVIFRNKGYGKVTVVKDAVPDDGEQDFDFTTDLNGAFTLDDDGGIDPTYSNTKEFAIVYAGDYFVTEASTPADWELTSITVTGDGDATTDLGTRTASIHVDPGEEIIITFVNERQLEFLKQFTGSGALDGFNAPTLYTGAYYSPLYSWTEYTKSGPNIWWEVTYSVTNEDDEAHNYIMWDKWGGNLLILNSEPFSFTGYDKKNDPGTLILANGEDFGIDYAGYSGYVGSAMYFDTAPYAPSDGTAFATLHSGDQQEGTNPGKGRGSNGKDGKSYDVDIRWEIGILEPGQTATLTIIIAPGINPGGILQFSSPGCNTVNTGPRVRVYGESYADEDFMYSVDKTNQLHVCVKTSVPPEAGDPIILSASTVMETIIGQVSISGIIVASIVAVLSRLTLRFKFHSKLRKAISGKRKKN